MNEGDAEIFERLPALRAGEGLIGVIDDGAGADEGVTGVFDGIGRAVGGAQTEPAATAVVAAPASEVTATKIYVNVAMPDKAERKRSRPLPDWALTNTRGTGWPSSS